LILFGSLNKRGQAYLRAFAMMLAAVILAAAASITAQTEVAHADPGVTFDALPSVPDQQHRMLSMGCDDNQIDLNHASTTKLQGLPGVSRPIAERIVDARPHDRVKDLLVVPGIGADTLSAIEASGRACSTPLTLPPPASDVCTTTSQIDVNEPAAQKVLATIFGKPTAERVVAAQPFPDLGHALTILVAGAGAGKVSKYKSQLCATPAPKSYAGTAYAWAYTRSGGRIDYKGASMLVPPKVLTAPTGNWLSITPADGNPIAQGPTFDIKVLGSKWSDGTKRVYLILPPDTFSPPEGSGSWIPTIVHGEPDAQEEFYGDGIRVQDDGRVAVAVTHLTTVQSLLQPEALFQAETLYPGVEKSTVLDSDIKEALTGTISPVGCSPDITHRTDAVQISSHPEAFTDGKWGLRRKVADGCAEGSLTSDHVTVKITNASALAFRLNDGYQTAADTQSVTYSSDVNLLTRSLLDYYGNSSIRPGEDESNVFYAQGTAITASVPLGADRSTYPITYDPQLTSIVFLTNKVGQILDIAEIPKFVTCLTNIGIKDTSADTIVGCAESVAKAIDDKEAIKKLAAVARVLNVVQDGRALVETVNALIYHIVNQEMLSGGLSVRYTRTPQPVVDSAGRLIPAQCWSPTGAIWTVNEPCYQEFLSSQSPPPAECSSSGTLNPQCTPATYTGTPPDGSGCWTYDPLAGTAGAWVLNATAGQGCLLLNSYTFCGVGECVPWPDASNRVVRTTDGRSYFIDARAQRWHLATTDAYFSCTAKFALLNNPASSDGKWLPDNLNNYPYSGERYGC
jgi:hypothetical protein